jgi:hypothetical protein
VERIRSISSGYFNLSVFGPTTAIINGVYGKLNFDKNELLQKESSAVFWDDARSQLSLGDFRSLVEFLVANSGRKIEIEVAINEN